MDTLIKYVYEVIQNEQYVHFILFSNKGPKGLLQVATKYNIIQKGLVKCCQYYLGFNLPSEMLAKRTDKFKEKF